MNKNYLVGRVLLVAFSCVGLGSCASIALKPHAHRVIASKTPAPKGCKYIGSVVGSQGGLLVGAYTSNKNLAEGSMNDLKNKAADIGANYVQIEADRAGFTHSEGSGGQTDVTVTGNAYRCDPREIGLD